MRLLSPRRRLVDGHLDGLFIVGHHYGPQGTVMRVDLLVVYGPEPVEHQALLIPGIGGHRTDVLKLVISHLYNSRNIRVYYFKYTSLLMVTVIVSNG